MANHPESQYEEYLLEATNLPLKVTIVKTDPPQEMLSLSLEGVGPLLRIPARDAFSPESLSKVLPRHLHRDAVTFKTRYNLLILLRVCPDVLAECYKKIEGIREKERAFPRFHPVVHSDETPEEPAIASLLNDNIRRLEMLLFSLDDTTIIRMQEIADRTFGHLFPT